MATSSCNFTHYGHKFTLSVTEQSYDVKANTSVVKWTLSVTDNGTWYDSYAKCTVNGSVVYNRSCGWDGGFPAQSGSTSGTLTVTHEQGGGKTIWFYLEGYAYSYSTQYANNSLALTSLDRSEPVVDISSHSSTSNSITFTITSTPNASQWAYQFKKTESSSYSSWVYDNTGGASRTLTISGLESNTEYDIFVAAKKSTNDVWGYKNKSNPPSFSKKTLGASIITSAADKTLGENSSVTWTPLDSSFKYKLNFSVGSWSSTVPASSSSYIEPGQTTAYTYIDYTIPTNGPAQQITNNATGSMNVTLTTYDSGENIIGDTSTSSFTVTIPASVVPNIISVNKSGIDSTFNRYIKNVSNLNVSVSAASSYGASISSYQVQFGGSTLTSSSSQFTFSSLSTPGTYSLTATVMDTRRRVGTFNAGVVSVYDYYVPTGTITTVVSGDSSLTTSVTWDIAPVDSTNSGSFTITRKVGSTVASSTSYNFSNNYTGSYDWVQTGVNTEENYSYEFIVTDKKNSSTFTTTITNSPIAISRLGGGGGITFFGEAQESGFWIVDGANYIRHDITSTQYLELARRLANSYDSAATYGLGTFVTYNGNVYENNEAIPTAEAWNSSHWDLIGVV